MRARKVVLLIDDRELERNVWELVFDSKGYAVMASAEMPWELHAVPRVAVLKGAQVQRNVSILRQLLPEVKILAITDNLGTLADVRLKPGTPMAEMLECLRILASRKRGPKPVAVMPGLIPAGVLKGESIESR